MFSPSILAFAQFDLATKLFRKFQTETRPEDLTSLPGEQQLTESCSWRAPIKRYGQAAGAGHFNNQFLDLRVGQCGSL